MKKIILLINITVLFWQTSFSQDARIDSLARRLDLLTANGVQLNQPITIVFDGLLKELISFLAESTKLNMTVMPGLEAQTTSVSFTNAPTRDVVLYLCQANRLDLQFTGSIISFFPFIPEPPPPRKPQEVDITFQQDSGFLTLNLKGDTLDLVVKKIIQLTSQNVVIDPAIRYTSVNGYISSVNLESALKQLAGNNGLVLKRESDYFRLESRFPSVGADGQPNPGGQSYTANRNASIQIERTGGDLVNIQANNADVLDILKEAAAQLGINYYLLPEGGAIFAQQIGNNNNTGYAQGNGNGPGASVTIQARQISFRDLLRQIFKNTGFDFIEQSGLYIIGRRTAESLRNHKIFQFQNRSIRGVLPLIPEDYIYDISIDTMPELNSIVLSGSQKSINNIEQFFIEVDKLVPVILIELVLIDVQSNKLSDLGVEAGIASSSGKPPAGGTIISSTPEKGGVNFTFSPGAINDLLNLLAGRGIINLGRVSPDFYLTLTAVQQDGIIEIKSTPKLSTLNSHRATLSIGQTRYYQEQQVSFPGTDRPVPVQSNVFREAEANLDIDITPIISGDEQVTLDIFFEQSEFIGESSLNAPPPKVSRKFESHIRVRNGEMVVLGGLEYEAKSKTRRGFPVLSKIPVLGWLFGRTKKTKQKNKLLIFVKPTIVH